MSTISRKGLLWGIIHGGRGDLEKSPRHPSWQCDAECEKGRMVYVCAWRGGEGRGGCIGKSSLQVLLHVPV